MAGGAVGQPQRPEVPEPVTEPDGDHEHVRTAQRRDVPTCRRRQLERTVGQRDVARPDDEVGLAAADLQLGAEDRGVGRVLSEYSEEVAARGGGGRVLDPPSLGALHSVGGDNGRVADRDAVDRGEVVPEVAGDGPAARHVGGHGEVAGVGAVLVVDQRAPAHVLEVEVERRRLAGHRLRRPEPGQLRERGGEALPRARATPQPVRGGRGIGQRAADAGQKAGALGGAAVGALAEGAGRRVD